MVIERVLVTGGTGFLGSRIVRSLVERRHLVTVLTRSAATARKAVPEGVRVVAYDPLGQGPWWSELGHTDAVIHLAGEPVVGVRWTDEKKRIFEQSRIDTSATLVRAIAAAPEGRRPGVFIGASAVGYYGVHAAGEALDESSPPGDDFLARLCVGWERAQAEAASYGLRVAHVRVGLVLGRNGGVLERMLLPFRLGVGGPIGSGAQVLSWIHEDDLAAIFLLALENERARGPLNGTAPSPVSMSDFAHTLGAVLRRPSFVRVPSFALRLAFGEGADPILGGQRVLPRRLEALGFRFGHPELREALESLLGGR